MAGGLDHQRVAIPAADGIAPPSRNIDVLGRRQLVHPSRSCAARPPRGSAAGCDRAARSVRRDRDTGPLAASPSGCRCHTCRCPTREAAHDAGRCAPPDAPSRRHCPWHGHATNVPLECRLARGVKTGNSMLKPRSPQSRHRPPPPKPLPFGVQMQRSRAAGTAGSNRRAWDSRGRRNGLDQLPAPLPGPSPRPRSCPEDGTANATEITVASPTAVGDTASTLRRRV